MTRSPKRDGGASPELGTISHIGALQRNIAKPLSPITREGRGRPYAELTLITWEKDGKGPPVTRIGRDVVYSIPSVERWLKAQERAGCGSTEAAA
jgi:hypothetical protein